MGMSERTAEKGATEPLPAVKALLARWDATSNPVFLSAAGQLRQALRADGRLSTAEATRPIPPTEDQP